MLYNNVVEVIVTVIVITKKKGEREEEGNIQQHKYPMSENLGNAIVQEIQDEDHVLIYGFL